MNTKKTFLSISLSVLLTAFLVGVVLAVNEKGQNDFVSDVNNGKSDLVNNQSGQNDAAEVQSGELARANDKDDGELALNDGQNSPEKSEPGESNNVSS
jgi:hypothetical protein